MTDVNRSERYHVVDSLDERDGNTPGEWLAAGVLVGIADEEAGGVIAYCHQDKAPQIVGILTQAAVDAAEKQARQVRERQAAEERKAKLIAIAAKVRADVPENLSLVYVDRGDEFQPQQVAVLLSGENPWESKQFVDMEEWESDQRYTSAIAAIKDVLDDDEWDLLDDEPELLDELRFEVYERDDSEWVDDMLRNTGSLLVRFDLDHEVSPTEMSAEEDLVVEAEEIVEALGLDLATHAALRDRIAGHLLPEAPYGGGLWILWYGDPHQLYKEAVAPVLAGDTVTVTFHNPTLLVLDKLNGSGHELQIEGDFTVPFKLDQFTTDQGDGGCSWTEIAGIHAGSYAAEPTFTVTPKVTPAAEG